MKRFFGRIEIRNECLHLTVKVEMYAYIFIYILSNGRFAQKKIKPSRILLVGIGYDKDKKKHKCKVEVMTPEWET